MVGDRLTAWLRGDEEELETALGIGGVGRRSIGTLQALERRDTLIRQAVAEYLGHHRSAHSRAEALAHQLARYRATTWPRHRTLPSQPPRIAGTIQGAFFEILKILDRDLGYRQVLRIIGNTSDMSSEEMSDAGG